jgi:hypothetical protein
MPIANTVPTGRNLFNDAPTLTLRNDGTSPPPSRLGVALFLLLLALLLEADIHNDQDAPFSNQRLN